MTDKKSGLFSRIASVLVEDVPDPSGSAHPTATPQAQPIIAPAPALSASVSGVDPEIRKLLEKDVGEAAKPAYSEFAALSQSMEAVLTNETQRFQAVLAAIAAKGHNIQQVIVDIDECFSALDAKEAQARATADRARQSQIGSREAELASVRKEIDQLRDALIQKEAKAESLVVEISKVDAALQETEARFANTVTAYRADLMSTKNKILSLSNGAR